MIRQEVKVGQKFELGASRWGKHRVLEVTSVTSLGANFKVTPGTYSGNNTEMYVDFRDSGFWNQIKSYKEKIVHKADVIWYKYNPIPGFAVDPNVHRWIYEHGQVLGSHVTELSRTTVEYTEERSSDMTLRVQEK